MSRFNFSHWGFRRDTEGVATFRISVFIEIAGVIYNDKYDSWREKEYTSKRHIEYKEKLLKKEQILLDSNKEYLFLFKTELLNSEYKNIFQNKIKTVLENVA